MSNLVVWIDWLATPLIRPTPHCSYKSYDQIGNAIDNISETNNLTAVETMAILKGGEVIIRPLSSLSNEEYEKIKSEGDPEHRENFVNSVMGFFTNPNQIFVDTDQPLDEVERTIVHEVQHYKYHNDSNKIKDCEFEDEMEAIEAEDRYSGQYITRLYHRKLKEHVSEIMEKRN